MTEEFIAGVVPPEKLTEPALWFIYRGNDLLCDPNLEAGVPQAIDPAEIGLSFLRQHYLGTLKGQACFAVEVDAKTEAPAGTEFKGLRFVYGEVPEAVFSIGGRAVQIIDWDRTHQFCGRCGAKTVTQKAERGKKCPECGLTNYPRLSPSMIVLVRRGDEVLLARAPRFPPEMYSVLAGFVEPGESVEETIHREVREEVGITVKNIRYFGSQSWPFPNSLMLGYMAEYESGEIVPQEEEIEDAAWFTAATMPKIPPRISIARQLIDAYLESIE